MFNTFLLILLLFLWGSIHSILASLPIKKFIKDRYGEKLIRYYRLAYNSFAVVSFLPILGLMFVLRDIQLYSIPKPWVFIPMVVQIFSLIILTIGLKQTGALEFLGLHVFLDEKKPVPQSLNKSGLYKYVRHPLYSAGLVLLWCSPIMTTNSLIVSICLSIYIVVGAIYEERKLIIEYGDIYEEYRRKVPMLIPWFKGNK